jgi:type II secretory pathway pseudopilin PulG
MPSRGGAAARARRLHDWPHDVRPVPVSTAFRGVSRRALRHTRRARGYAMAALLVGVSVLCVMTAVALPMWRTAARREREAELIFRGEQYVRAITRFQRQYAGTLPPSIDALLQGRFLRRRYLDPITDDAFEVLYADVPGGGARQGAPAPSTIADPRRGIVGVVSRSQERALREYHGRDRYNQWLFVIEGSGPGANGAARREGRPGAKTVELH